MDDKILVSGASGFLGKALLERLIDSDSRIVALYNQSPKPKVHDGYGGKIKWIQTDLIYDDLGKYFDGVKTVYHLAARFALGNTPDTFDELYPLNVIGTERLAQAAVEKGVKKFIHISSIAACEVGDELVINEDNGHPESSYGLSKLKSEEVLTEIAKGKMDFVILRPTALFGENHLGSIFELVTALRKGCFSSSETVVIT